MEWSLTQNKLLAFHRLMRTISQLARYYCSGQHYGRCGWRTGRSPALDPGGVCRGRLADGAAGCVVNDYADRKFDGHVKARRTDHFPAAR